MIFKSLLLFVTNPTKIFLNLDKINELLIHAGITFKNNKREVRYDFRAFNYNNTYVTDEHIRKNISEMFPDLFGKDSKQNDIHNIYTIYSNVEYDSKEVYWGTSNFSIDELIEIENSLHKEYVLGIYDCRHYVNEICKIALDKEIPIWNLKSL